ncbi:MAG TPA: hypothetical protein VI636_13445 [Candidatus Angelobacter sp.]
MDEFAFQCGYCTPGFLMGLTLWSSVCELLPFRQAMWTR